MFPNQLAVFVEAVKNSIDVANVNVIVFDGGTGDKPNFDFEFPDFLASIQIDG